MKTELQLPEPVDECREREKILLLVDDEANILSALTRLLRRDGYKILTANSAEEGLALLKKHEVGVIVSDQRMPNMIGSEFLEHAKKIRPDTIRIILSGYTELNTVTDAINRGAVYKFFTKPWDDELLRNHIKDAFKQYDLHNENQRLTTELQVTNKVLYSLVDELEQMVAQHTKELRSNVAVLQVSQAIFDYLPVGVIGLAEDGLITTANQRAKSLLNNQLLTASDSADILPKDLQDYLASADDEGHRCVLNDLSIEVRVTHFSSPPAAHGKIVVLIPHGEKI